jgi:hypothetical protein
MPYARFPSVVTVPMNPGRRASSRRLGVGITREHSAPVELS